MSRTTVSGVLTRKTTRSIRHNWGQFLAIIGITAIAVTLFLGLSASAKSLDERVDRLYSECNVADIWVTTSGYEEDDQTALENMLDSEDLLEKRSYLPSYLGVRSMYAVIVDEYPAISAPIIVDDIEGTDYYSENAEFLIVDDSMEIAAGETVEVSFSSSLFSVGEESLSSYVGDLVSLEFKVTSTMNYAENINTAEFSTSCFVISTSYFKDVFTDYIMSFSGLSSIEQNVIVSLINSTDFSNQFVIKAGENTNVKALESQINSYYSSKEENNLVYLYDLDSAVFNSIVQADIQQAWALSYVFPAIFFLVAVLVILTTISQLIIKERMEIGTLKAIGVNKNQILSQYMALMFVLVGIGFVIGAILGPIILPMIMGIKYNILYSLPPFRFVFPWLYFVIALVALMALTALVVWLACRKEMKLMPVSSMRPPQIKALKPKKDEGNHRFEARFIYIKMALRNIRLSPAKSVMVVLGILGCTMLLVSGYGIDDTIDYSVDYDLANFYAADITLHYNTGSTSMASELEQFEEIEYFEEQRTETSTVTNQRNGIQYETYIYIVSESPTLINIDFDADYLCVSQKVANEANVKIGDELTFEIMGKEYSGVVGQIYDTFVYHGVFASSTNEAYKELYETKTTAFISVADGVDHDEFGTRLLSEVSEAASYTTHEWTVDYINSIVSSVDTMTLSIKIFAILLAVVVLFNLTYLNFKERTRQIATLKVVGFSRANIGKTLVYESMILVVIGAVLGLLLGFPLEILILFINRNAIVEFLYVCTWQTYLISFLITTLVALAINLLLTLRIKNVKMVESLKSIEE
ncbi:MAG: ABC transporter permease [Coprobacillus sp.]|nr:ABC transporter permease [Coprobacillus sp.]